MRQRAQLRYFQIVSLSQHLAGALEAARIEIGRSNQLWADTAPPRAGFGRWSIRDVQIPGDQLHQRRGARPQPGDKRGIGQIELSQQSLARVESLLGIR